MALRTDNREMGEELWLHFLQTVQCHQELSTGYNSNQTPYQYRRFPSHGSYCQIYRGHRYESPTLCLTNALVITFRTFDYRVRGTAFDYSEWQAHRGSASDYFRLWPDRSDHTSPA